MNKIYKVLSSWEVESGENSLISAENGNYETKDLALAEAEKLCADSRSRSTYYIAEVISKVTSDFEPTPTHTEELV